jgi:hypothetical protein
VARGTEEEEQAARVALLVFLVDIHGACCGGYCGGFGVEESWDYLKGGMTGWIGEWGRGLRHESTYGWISAFGELGIGRRYGFLNAR